MWPCPWIHTVVNLWRQTHQLNVILGNYLFATGGRTEPGVPGSNPEDEDQGLVIWFRGLGSGFRVPKSIMTPPTPPPPAVGAEAAQLCSEPHHPKPRTLNPEPDTLHPRLPTLNS